MPRIANPATRKGSRIIVRVRGTGHDAITARAREETDGNVSELTRRMLAYATAHMPRGWKPGGGDR